MARAVRQYRSFEEFEREEIFRPRGFVQTLDEFQEELMVSDDDIIDLFDPIEDDR
jgi:hypothetical protein